MFSDSSAKTLNSLLSHLFLQKIKKTNLIHRFNMLHQPIDLSQKLDQLSHSFCDLSPIDTNFLPPQVDFSIIKQDEIHSSYHSLYLFEDYFMKPCSGHLKCSMYPPNKIQRYDGFTNTYFAPAQSTYKKVFSQTHQSSTLSLKKEFYLGLETPFQEKKYASNFLKKLNQGSAQLPKDYSKATYLKQVISDLNKPKKPPLQDHPIDFIDYNCVEEDYWYDEY